MNQRNICILVAVVLSSLGCDGKLPQNIKICNRNEPNLAKCIIESVRKLQPHLANGDLGPEFRVPPLEPLKVDNILIDRGKNFQASVTNVVTRGASKFVIEKLRANIDEITFDFQLLLPKIEFKGKYNLNLRIALVPIVVNDKDFIGVAENFRARVRLTGKKYVGQDGKTYISFIPIQLKIIPGAFDVELVDLFKNSPTLEAIGKAFLKDNRLYFLAEVIPSLEKSLGAHFTGAANQIVKRASLDELFP